MNNKRNLPPHPDCPEDFDEWRRAVDHQASGVEWVREYLLERDGIRWGEDINWRQAWADGLWPHEVIGYVAGGRYWARGHNEPTVSPTPTPAPPTDPPA